MLLLLLGYGGGKGDLLVDLRSTDRSQLVLIGFSASVFVAVDRGAGIHQWNMHMIDLVQVAYVSRLLLEGIVMACMLTVYRCHWSLEFYTVYA